MTYKFATKKFPEVRKEEYELLNKFNISKATQWPFDDSTVTIPKDSEIGLSFINLHHFNNKKIQTTLYNNFKIHHLFEVKEGSKQAEFLDWFIPKYSSREHKGNYLSTSKIEPLLINKKIVKEKTVNYKWYLKKEIAKPYFRLIFRLSKQPSLKDLEYLNYDGNSLDWQILYLRLENEK